MQSAESELLRKAHENPNWMFDETEIGAICNVSQVIVGRVSSAQDSPFFLGKCRPEWFVEWMRRHTDFGAAQKSPHRGLPKGTSQDSGDANPWAQARRAQGGQKER